MTTSKEALHPDSKYIMADNIGPIIAKGLSKIYKEKPKNPIDHFAKWLLQQSDIQHRNEFETKKAEVVEALLTKKARDIKVEKAAKAEKAKEKQKLDQKIVDFKKKIEASKDLNDNLQDLVDHL